jgi:hypothetical protein
MTAAFRSAGTFSSSTTAATPGLPAGWQQNDLFLLLVESDNQAITAPSGYTEQGAQASKATGTTGGTGASATRLGVFWKIAGSSESGPSVADTGNHTSAQLLAFSGVNTSSPFDASTDGVEATSDTSGSVQSVTTTAAGELVVVVCSTGADVASTAQFSAWANSNLTGLAEITDQCGTAGNGGGFGAAAGTMATAGATGATTVTLATASPKGLCALALASAPAPETSPQLEASGFGTFSGVRSPDTINSVTATVNQWQSSASFAAPVYQLWDGTSAQIGSDVTGTASTSTSNTDSPSWTGVTYSQLATLRLRITAHSGVAASGATQSVDWVALTVNYSPAGAAALSGTGSLSAAVTQQFGPVIATRTRHVGAALGSGTTGDQTPAQFLTTVGGSRYAEGHFFFGATVPASLAAAPQGLSSYAGVRRALVDFELTHYGVSGTYPTGTPAAGAVTDRAALETFIQSCQAGGLDLVIQLWHEPYNKFNTQATVALNNQDHANSVGYYGEILRKYGIPVIFNPSNYSAQNHNTPGTDNPVTIGTAANPGLGWSACALGYIDEIRSDFYVNQQGVSSQGVLDACGNLAAAFGLPFGLNELGFAPADLTAYTQADVDSFTSYALGYLASWAAAGNQLSDIVAWATNDNAVTAGMYLSTSWSSTTLARYQSLFDTYDGGTYLTAQPANLLTGTGSLTAGGTSGTPGTTPGITGTAGAGSTAAVASQAVANPGWNGTSTPAGLLILLWPAAQAASTTFTCTGFTAVTAATGQNTSAQLLYRTTDGSEGATFTVTPSASRLVGIAAIALDTTAAANSGFDPAVPTSSGQLLAATGSSLPATGVTTASNSDLLIWFGMSRVTSSPVAAISPPAGYTTQLSQVNTTGSGANVGVTIATAVQISGGATGTVTGSQSLSTADGGALLVAVAGPTVAAATAALSGAGTLGSAAALLPAAGLAGSGTLLAAPVLVLPGAAALSGSGTLSVFVTTQIGGGTGPAGTAYRLFPSTSGPGSPVSYSGNFLAGVIFKVTQGGMWFSGYYKWVAAGGDTTARKFALWQVNGPGTGVLLPAATVTSGTLTAGQWNFVALSTPVPLAIGTAYNACTGWTAVAGFEDSDTTGAGTGAADSFGTGGHTGGITQGPLFAFSDHGSSAPEPYGMAQGVFSTAGTDPAVIMPGTGSNSANFWMDVQVSDADPSGYTGPYRLWPGKADTNPQTTTDSAVNYDISTEFALSRDCTLGKVWYFSPPGTAQLATSASIWNITGGGLTGTLAAQAASPSWSGAAASGWISCSFTGVTLPAGKYKVSVYNSAATPDNWGAKDAGTDYWRAGEGANGITWGPLSAPKLSDASLAYNYNGSNGGSTPPFTDGTTLPGQPTFTQGPPDSYPYLFAPVTSPSAGSTQNYWIDVEVTPVAPAGGPGVVLSGTGTLTSGTVQQPAAALSGAGALSTAIAQQAAVLLSGAGSLSTAAAQQVTAGLSGTGSLTTAVGGAMPAGAVLSGTGTLGAGSAQKPPAALSGSGTLSASAGLTLPAAAALAGSGALSAAVTQGPGTGLAGTGTLAAAYALGPGAVLAGSGTLAAAPAGVAPGGAALSGSGLLAAAVLAQVTIALSGTGTLSARSGAAVITDSDSCHGEDSGFAFLASAESCSAAESAVIKVSDADHCTAAERELTAWPHDSDACTARETARQSGPVSGGSDACAAADGGELIRLASSDACTAADDAPGVGIYTFVPSWRTGPGGGWYEVVWVHPLTGRRHVLVTGDAVEGFLGPMRAADRKEKLSADRQPQEVPEPSPGLDVTVSVVPALEVAVQVTRDIPAFR